MTPPLNSNPPMQTMQVAPKKKGCGCCLWGCFGLGVVAVLFVIGAFLGLRMATDFVLSDGAAKWVYNNYGREAIKKALPENLTADQKDRVMQETDKTLDEFFALPPEEKSVLKQEAVEAYWLYERKQIIPPEKIAHLKPYLEKVLARYQSIPGLNIPSLPQ